MKKLLFLSILINFFLVVTHAGTLLKRKKDNSADVRRQAVGPCNADEFQCANGRCIDAEWVCDTEDDCHDHSDEQHCRDRGCSGVHQFHCSDGDCIPFDFKCDGDVDCNDHSDEQNCENMACTDGEIMCPDTHICIEMDRLCNGFNDCGGEVWDETVNCTHGG